MSVSLSQFPYFTLKNILSNLSSSELSKISVVDKTFYVTCRNILKDRIKKLESIIELEMLSVSREITEKLNALSNNYRIPHMPMRCYNALEVLRCELKLLLLLYASYNVNDNKCFPAGILIDSFFAILDVINSRSLAMWTLETDCTRTLQIKIKNFVDGFTCEKEFDICSPNVGSKLIDLLSLLIGVQTSMTVTLTRHDNMSCFYGNFILDKPRVFVSTPPDFLLQERENVLNKTDATCLLRYFVVVIRFHNRLLLREEQHWREMDYMMRNLGARLLLTDFNWSISSFRRYDFFEDAKPKVKRDEDVCTIQMNNTTEASHNDSLVCTIRMECPPQQLPSRFRSYTFLETESKSSILSGSNQETLVDPVEYFRILVTIILPNGNVYKIFQSE